MKARRTEEWELIPDVGERFKAAQKASDLSVSSLCGAVDISTTFWYQVLKGSAASITRDKLDAICAALEIDVEELITDV